MRPHCCGDVSHVILHSYALVLCQPRWFADCRSQQHFPLEVVAILAHRDWLGACLLSFPYCHGPCTMCDFRKLNDMVLQLLPYVEEWSWVQVHKDQLEVALAGVAALMLGVGSQYNYTLLAVLCSVAGHILAAGDPDAGDLSPTHWVPSRPSPCSVITWVLALPQAQAHLLAFQLAAALEMVSQWITAESPLLSPEALLVAKHLKVCLFDILVPVRLAAGGQAAESLFAHVPSHPGQTSDQACD